MFSKNAALAALALSSSVMTEHAAYAQSGAPAPTPSPPAAAAANTPAELAPVTIKSAIDRDDRSESIGGKIVVTREDLARFGDTSIGEVLNRLPGVTINGVPGRGGEIRMRGLGTGYVAILINGEPTAPGFSIDSLSPTLIDRIEVLRSPVADKSAQAIAGTINIILKRSVKEGQRDIKALAGSEAGRPTASLGGQLSDRAGDISYSLAGEIKHDQFVRPTTIERTWVTTDGVAVRANVADMALEGRRDQLSLTPRISWQATEHDAFTAEGLLTYEAFRPGRTDTYTTSLGEPPSFQRVDVTQKSDTSTVRLRTSWEHGFDDGAKFETKLGASQSHLDQLVDYANYDDQHVLQLVRDIDGPLTDRALTFSGKYQAQLAKGHTLSAGWDGERSQRSSRRIQTDQTPTGLIAPDNLDERFDAIVERLAFYGQDEWVIDPTWSAYGGLRWESVKTGGGSGADQFSNRTGVLSPILQSLWKVPDTHDDKLRVALSRTYRMPTMFDLSPRRYVGSSENSPTSPDSQGNPALKPELAWGLDLGYERYLADDAGLLAVNTTWRQIKDVNLVEVYLDPATGLWISRPYNSGQAHVLGLELEAKLRLRKLLPSAPALDMRVNLSRNWSWVDAIQAPHNRLFQQTPASANLGLDWRPDGTPLTLGGNLGVVDNGTVAVSTKQTFWKSVSRQLDAYGLLRLDAKTQVRLSFSNLLHQSQQTFGIYDGVEAGTNLRQTTTSPSFTAIRIVLEKKL